MNLNLITVRVGPSLRLSLLHLAKHFHVTIFLQLSLFCFCFFCQINFTAFPPFKVKSSAGLSPFGFITIFMQIYIFLLRPINFTAYHVNNNRLFLLLRWRSGTKSSLWRHFSLHDDIFWLRVPGTSCIRPLYNWIEYRNVMLRASCIVSSLMNFCNWRSLERSVGPLLWWLLVQSWKVSTVVKCVEFSALSNEFLGNNARQQSLWCNRFGLYHTFPPFSPKFCLSPFELQQLK